MTSHILAWFLIILLPNEGAGRQVGPFTEPQCRAAQAAYNDRMSRYNGPQSLCVQGMTRTN